MAEFAYPNLEGLGEAYARDGHAIVRQVIDGDPVAEANRHVDWLIEHNPKKPKAVAEGNLIRPEPGVRARRTILLGVDWEELWDSRSSDGTVTAGSNNCRNAHRQGDAFRSPVLISPVPNMASAGTAASWHRPPNRRDQPSILCRPA